jgi:protein-tyrosine phosphatase
VQVLFVCSANICRSPMAAALFALRAAERGGTPVVRSAGLLDAGVPAPQEVLGAMAAYGIDLGAHRSRALDSTLVSGADLVVGMSLRHVQQAALLDPDAWERIWRLKEVVRQGASVGPRLPGQGTGAWVRAAQGDRTRSALVRVSPDDDVVDPYGGPPEGYAATAAELDALTTALADLLWPPG